jgi:hypothetical protein
MIRHRPAKNLYAMEFQAVRGFDWNLAPQDLGISH